MWRMGRDMSESLFNQGGVEIWATSAAGVDIFGPGDGIARHWGGPPDLPEREFRIRFGNRPGRGKRPPSAGVQESFG
jgi:hypothetical protein